jgi:hypothetical protein
VTPDFIDFVEVRARIKREQFLGFTSAAAPQPSKPRAQQPFNVASDDAPPPSPQQPAALWQSLLPACLSPAPTEPAGAGAFGGGGAVGVGIEGTEEEFLSGGRGKGAGRKPWGAALAGWSSSPRAQSGGGGIGGAPWHQQQQQQVGTSAGLGGGGEGSPRIGAFGSFGGSSGGGKTGVWQVLWQSERTQHQLCFEATHEA